LLVNDCYTPLLGEIPLLDGNAALPIGNPS
jgi:hypothetical protein